MISAVVLLLSLATFAPSPLLALRININTGGGAACTTDPSKCTTVGDIPLTIGGSLTFVNCRPSSASVRLNSEILAATGGVNISGNNYMMFYSKTYPQNTNPVPGPFTLVPSASCTGGAWTPASSSVQQPPSTNQNFVYVKGQSISMDLIAAALTGFMQGAVIYLNNYDGHGGLTQTSVFQLGTINAALYIPKVTVDLDCGTFCPDLGDAYFYVNKLRVSSISFAAYGDALKMTLTFAAGSRQIKGFYNNDILGDDGIPDFNIANAKVDVIATPVPTTAGAGLTLLFSGATLTADISSTGGCNIFGVDICDFVFGTSGMIKKGIEDAINSALGTDSLQGQLAGAIQTYLKTIGITQTIASFGVYNGNIYIVLPDPRLVNVLANINTGLLSNAISLG